MGFLYQRHRDEGREEAELFLKLSVGLNYLKMKTGGEPGMVAHACNTSAREAEAGGLPEALSSTPTTPKQETSDNPDLSEGQGRESGELRASREDGSCAAFPKGRGEPRTVSKVEG